MKLNNKNRLMIAACVMAALAALALWTVSLTGSQSSSRVPEAFPVVVLSKPQPASKGLYLVDVRQLNAQPGRYEARLLSENGTLDEGSKGVAVTTTVKGFSSNPITMYILISPAEAERMEAEGLIKIMR
jgi:hypothetical protein